MNNSQNFLGKKVKVKIDRPLGSKHPKFNFIYNVNYGYIPNTQSGDGEEIDAYVLGIDTPISEFEGKCIAIIQRTDDNDDKLIVVPSEIFLSNEEIEKQTYFQEKWFEHKIIRHHPTLHLMCGFLGFGKTTIAKRLEKELPAVRFTHDEIMLQHYGRNPDNFQEKYQEVDSFIRNESIKFLNKGLDVILDYGFWSKEKRKEYKEWGKAHTPNIIFHAVVCDIEIAKRRVLERTKNNPNELFINEDAFNKFLKNYEPISKEENEVIIYHSTI